MNATARTARSKSRSLVDRSTLPVAVGDVVLVAGLLLYGHIEHGGTPIAEPLPAIETIVPFLFGWVVASVLAGVYARDVATSVTRTARLTAVAWFAAANIGLLLRSSPLFDGGSPWPFVLIVTATGLVALVAWRVGYAVYAGAETS